MLKQNLKALVAAYADALYRTMLKDLHQSLTPSSLDFLVKLVGDDFEELYPSDDHELSQKDIVTISNRIRYKLSTPRAILKTQPKFAAAWRSSSTTLKYSNCIKRIEDTRLKKALAREGLNSYEEFKAYVSIFPQGIYFIPGVGKKSIGYLYSLEVDI